MKHLHKKFNAGFVVRYIKIILFFSCFRSVREGIRYTSDSTSQPADKALSTVVRLTSRDAKPNSVIHTHNRAGRFTITVGLTWNTPSLLPKCPILHHLLTTLCWRNGCSCTKRLTQQKTNHQIEKETISGFSA